MGEHTSSNQTSPTDSAPDLPDIDELIREEWNSRNKFLEAAARKPDGGRRGSNEESRAGGFGSVSSAKRRSIDLDSPDQSSGSAAKRRSIDQSSPTQGGSIKVTSQDRRRSSSGSIKMDNNNNEATSSSGKGKAESSSSGSSNSHSSIPPLDNNVAAAIFVPLTSGQALLSPPAVAPETPPYFLEKLERLTAHEAAVRGNIEALYGLEYLRVRAAVAATYPDDDASFDYFGATAAVRSLQENALREDLDVMIDSMRKPEHPVANPGLAAANLEKDVAVVLPNMGLAGITYLPLNSPREAAATDILKVLGDAATELGSFDNHVQLISDGIKREMEGAAARGMREKQDRMDTD
ncbi:hypothetical protein HDV57DRAFT_301423 [Trichoderma longibrachiatum]|uniref:Uncharacterized protein n=1 Tax=Trichoderma longibrachiatum ATCC 18648 TaxID=983965 RepID=A0A2T4CCE1_TRILO|nr:hypothetical protein M440DRAFT_1389272 [Trichoderma longibrachiatum ATCC 18648]